MGAGNSDFGSEMTYYGFFPGYRKVKALYLQHGATTDKLY